MRWLLAVEPHPRLGWLEGVMLTFCGYSLLSCLMVGGSGPVPSVRKDLIFVAQGYWMPFAAWLLARHFARDAHGRTALLYTIILIGALVGLTGVLQYLFGITWFNPSRHEAIRGERAGGTLASAVEYGLVLLNASAALLALWLRGRSALWLPLAGVILVAGIVCSQTRSVWLGFLILLAVLWLWERQLWRPLALAGIGFVLGMLTILPFVADRLHAFQERATELGPIYNRIALAATAGDMIAERPLFGFGFAQHTFQDHKTAHVTTFFGVPTVAVEPRVPHNEWLHLWVLGGICAVVLYNLILWGCLRPLPALLRRHQSATALAAWGAALVFLANGLVVDLGMFPFASAQVFALLGAARAAADDSESSV